MRLHTLFDTEDEPGFLYRWFLKKRSDILTDNFVFFLHYHVTAAIFFMGCLIITIGMFLLDPIDCITDKAVDDIIDNYCLYHSTHTFINGATGSTNKNLTPHPGIIAGSKVSSEQAKFHHYYLWVAFMLLIQGASFYIPRGLWKHWEGSRIANVLKEKEDAFAYREKSVDSHCDSHSADSSTSTQPMADQIPEYIVNQCTNEDVLPEQNSRFRGLILYILSRSHYSYYWQLFVCEFLNLFNAIFQLLLIDKFLGFGLSIKSLWYNEDLFQLFKDKRPFEKDDAVEQIFPRIAACTFYTYGPSGNIINYQAVCVLSINSINEKIYAVIYAWLLFLISISVLAVVYRLLMLLPYARNMLLTIHLRSDELGKISLGKLRKKLRIGNWQLLLQLTGNSKIDSWELTNIVKHLCTKCEHMH